MSKEMLEAFATLEKTKGIKQDVIVEAIKAALVAAYKKNYNQATNVIVEFDERKGDFKLMTEKTVVEEVHDERLEISLKDALTINRAYELGDKIRFEVAPKNFGRIAAQTAKQVIMQHLREAERNHIIDEYSQYEDELITGTVERRDNRFVYVKIGNVEVPEIYDGTVEVVSIAREAGDRTKIAVKSNDPNIDPVGTCVGQRGARVQNVVNELDGENIDVVKYEEDPSDYIANALNPAEVIAVQFGDEDEEKSALVIVPDYQLSLAIGKKGQNVRLAARLTGYKIDIRPESEVEFVDESSDQAEKENEEAETNNLADDGSKSSLQENSDFAESEESDEDPASEEAEQEDEVQDNISDGETVDSTEN